MTRCLKLYLYLGLRKLVRFLFNKEYTGPIKVTYLKGENESIEQIKNKLGWYIPIEKEIEIRSTNDFLNKPDLLFISNHKFYLSLKSLRHIGVSFPVDKSFYDHYEVSNWIYSYYYTLSQEMISKFEKKSLHNFEQFNKLKNSKKAYLFGSGPSIEEYNKFDIDKSAWKIICNSLVKNVKFIDEIEIDAITIADPVFHFGHSKYACAFRKDLINRWLEKNFYIFLPAVNLPLFEYHFPFLKNHLIGVRKGKKIKKINDNSGMISVFPTENILTYLMLPLGFQLANELFLIGFDGKSSNSNKGYFWSHQREFQYLDLIQSAKNEHPSFFNDRSYEKYYYQHCKHLERYVNFSDQNNIKIRTLTKSFIHCLAQI